MSDATRGGRVGARNGPGVGAMTRTRPPGGVSLPFLAGRRARARNRNAISGPGLWHNGP